MVKCQLKTNHDLADLQQAEMIKKNIANVFHAINEDIWTIDKISEVTGLSWKSC